MRRRGWRSSKNREAQPHPLTGSDDSCLVRCPVQRNAGPRLTARHRRPWQTLDVRRRADRAVPHRSRSGRQSRDTFRREPYQQCRDCRGQSRTRRRREALLRGSRSRAGLQVSHAEAVPEGTQRPSGSSQERSSVSTRPSPSRRCGDSHSWQCSPPPVRRRPRALSSGRGRSAPSVDGGDSLPSPDHRPARERRWQYQREGDEHRRHADRPVGVLGLRVGSHRRALSVNRRRLGESRDARP